MPVFKVNVKWGKEKFSNVECNTDEPPMVFKAQLFALSGVEPDRQKVMIKGSVLKDDEWGNIKLTNGAMLLMMGSLDAVPTAPVKKTVFVEDMSEQQLASVMELPAGLTNLGNTCYMNATLQCLRSVPELKEALKKHTGSLALAGSGEADQSITAAMRDLFESMDRSSAPIPPIIMLQVLHMCFPHFSEKTDHGDFQQQDANECWTELVRCLQRRVPSVQPQDLASCSYGATDGKVCTRKLFMDQFFAGEFKITLKCVENEEEETTNSVETFYQLSCFIEKEVKYMHTGLKSRLEEDVEKNSPTLGRNAKYHKSSKISRLPAYLTIQFVRFYFKEKEAINAKILKDIKFPMSLDVYDLCTEELQKQLVPHRAKFKQEEDNKLEQQQLLVKGESGTAKSDESPEKKNFEPYWFPDDVGSNSSGYYELQAVLTHKGRSSSSGHYVAWVRKRGDEWIMFDDDKVGLVTADDILKLSGGGDWHCAYVLLYGPRKLEASPDKSANGQTQNMDVGP